MAEPSREKDVAALRTALVCVGLSGVFLGVFVLLAGSTGWKAPVVSGLLGLGVAALGVFRPVSLRISRPMRIFVYWLLSALLVLELMVPLNYASSRRHLTFDWTEGKIRSLSDWTFKVLGQVKKPVRVTTFFNQTEPSQAMFFNVVRDLLEEYRKACPNLAIEHVDPSRDTDRMTALAKQMNLEDLSEMPSVVFQCGDARKDVPIEKLLPRSLPGAEFDTRDPSQWAFYGEEEFTAALLEVTEPRQKSLFFTTNHGELDVDGPLADVAAELRRDNYAVRKFEGLAQGVPDNCTVLLIVGPKSQAKFSAAEQSQVERYLRGGGKLLFAVSGGEAAGLEPILGNFGIDVGRNVIIDRSTGRAALLVPGYPVGGHEVVSNLREYAIVFNWARSVDPLPPQPAMMGQDYYRAYPLLQTGKNCWAETDLDTLINKGSATFDPKLDKTGPLGLAAVYEQPAKLPNGEELPKDRPRTRIVAVGCGDFMVGQAAVVFGGNRQFFFNAVNWLAQKEELISVPPKRFDFRPIEMTPADANLVFWLVIAGVPVLFLVVGAVIWLVRRRG